MNTTTSILLGVVIFLLFAGIIAGGVVRCGWYNIWEQGLAGQAELKRAEQNRQISIQEAQALKESAHIFVTYILICCETQAEAGLPILEATRNAR
jgi:hypothetical protein